MLDFNLIVKISNYLSFPSFLSFILFFSLAKTKKNLDQSDSNIWYKINWFYPFIPSFLFIYLLSLLSSSSFTTQDVYPGPSSFLSPPKKNSPPLTISSARQPPPPPRHHHHLLLLLSQQFGHFSLGLISLFNNLKSFVFFVVVVALIGILSQPK